MWAVASIMLSAIAKLLSCPSLDEYMAMFSSTGITVNCCRAPAAASA